MRANEDNDPADIFDAARQLAPEERTQFLQLRCNGDQALRRRIEGLLRAAERADNFFAESTTAVTQAGMSLGAFSTSTRHMRHTAGDGSEGW